MEENKKGMNVLYPVLGVATLVVAIIGATFAFFSASQTADNIQGTVAESGGLILDVTSITDYYDAEGQKFLSRGTNIIPLNLIKNEEEAAREEAEKGQENGYKWTSQFADAVANRCVDDLGNNVCEIYKITVTNQSATSKVQVRGTLSLSKPIIENETTQVAANMYWKLINAKTTTAGDASSQYEVLDVSEGKEATEIEGFEPVQQGTALENSYLTVENTATGEGATPVYEGANVELAPSASQTYYVIVWLEEIGEEQEDVDASTGDTNPDDDTNDAVIRGYKGTVTFDAVDASGHKSGVTATFNKSV